MNTERLKVLADFLLTVPSEQFNLREWRSRENDDDGSSIDDEELLEDCKTTACAVGWACTIPAFKEAGLAFGGHHVWFEGECSWGAVQEFFGLYKIEATYLFSHASYVGTRRTPEDVADRIYEMIDAR
jgi:hypothetical protein